MIIEEGDFFIIAHHKHWRNSRVVLGYSVDEEESGFVRTSDRSWFDYIFKARNVTDTLICAEVVGFLNSKIQHDLGRKMILRVEEVEMETISKSEVEFSNGVMKNC